MKGRYQKGATRTLPPQEGAIRRAPALRPGRDWKPQTRAWWKSLFRSPMASEYLQVDLHGLYRLAVLVDRFWLEGTPSLAAEIRLEASAYGLDPLSRLRLQWVTENVEKTAQKGAKSPDLGADPRILLMPTDRKRG